MNIVEQLAENREFSVKEICDIISVVMLISEQGVPNESTIENIIQNACSNEHSANVIKNITQHVQDVANSIAENREVDDINAMQIAFGSEH